MSKSIASYPANMQPIVVARRMRAYDPKGINGIGTLAAKDAYDKSLIKKSKPAKGAK
jgi:hypothetical protein